MNSSTGSSTKRGRRSRNPDLSGLLLVDKPSGCTSHDVVQLARRALGQRKIGHCGTLDPAATGLLVLTVGRGTRLTRFLISAPKSYEGTLRLGLATDTYDAEGAPLFEGETTGLTTETVARAMSELEGTYLQSPPPYSAKKVGGKKLYELAREGREVPREPNEVEVFEFRALSELAEDRVRFTLSCSSGTYARSLVHDVGTRLGCGAHLEALRRTRVGHFELADAVRSEVLESLSGPAEGLAPAWIPFDRIPLPFETVVVDARQEQRIANGQTVVLDDLESAEGHWLKLTSARGRFLAVGTVNELIGDRVAVVRPRIVFI